VKSVVYRCALYTINDEIGLLSPQKQENGYRYYLEEDMSLLQMILFYKYLGFSLKKIKELLKKEDREV
jgi:DNA-binding transcriptional MerR regulator